jgi:hypothetical protein
MKKKIDYVTHTVLIQIIILPIFYEAYFSMGTKVLGIYSMNLFDI